MKIFIIKRDDYRYSEYDAHIVRAERKEDVFKVCNDYDFTKENATIEEITIDGEPEILLSSFNEG